jgi:hypothetical protein
LFRLELGNILFCWKLTILATWAHQAFGQIEEKRRKKGKIEKKEKKKKDIQHSSFDISHRYLFP